MRIPCSEISRAVSSLKPGYAIKIDSHVLSCVIQEWFPPFTVNYWILEKILGSAYEFSYRVEQDGTVFYRELQPLMNGRTYVSPDRR